MNANECLHETLGTQKLISLPYIKLSTLLVKNFMVLQLSTLSIYIYIYIYIYIVDIYICV